MRIKKTMLQTLTILMSLLISYTCFSEEQGTRTKKDKKLDYFIRLLRENEAESAKLDPHKMSRMTANALWPNAPAVSLEQCLRLHRMPTEQLDLLTVKQFESGLIEKNVPKEVRDQLVLLTVTYHGFDQKEKNGQLVIHRDLASSVARIFSAILKTDFVFTSILPISFYGWSDPLSIKFNNTSGFNWRMVGDSDEFSDHAIGAAIDINPWLNPWLKVGEESSRYKPEKRGTLTQDSTVVKIFEAEGWTWGGSDSWVHSKDWQHFYRPEIAYKYYGKKEVSE